MLQLHVQVLEGLMEPLDQFLQVASELTFFVSVSSLHYDTDLTTAVRPYSNMSYATLIAARDEYDMKVVKIIGLA